MSKEVWKSVKGFEGLYEISSLGRVKSSYRTKKILRPVTQRGGYLQVSLSKNKTVYYRKVHRLVAEAFLKYDSERFYVNHKDCNKKNNIPSNLEYCTMAENNKHAGDNNLKPIGTNHTNSKFTHNDLKEIRNLIKQKISSRKIGKMFGVAKSTILNIKHNRTYYKEIT